MIENTFIIAQIHQKRTACHIGQAALSKHCDGVDVDGDIGAQMKFLFLEKIMHFGKVRGLDEYDKAVDAAEAGNDGRRWANGLIAVLPRKLQLEFLDEGRGLVFGLFLVFILIQELDQTAVRRIKSSRRRASSFWKKPS